MFLTVDNPAGGNCAFYAYAIALIDVIKREFHTNNGNSRTFDTWCKLDKELQNQDYIKAVLEFDYKNQNVSLLYVLQTSLREIIYKEQCRQLAAGEQLAECDLLLISLDEDDDTISEDNSISEDDNATSADTLAALKQIARQTNNPILIKRGDNFSLYVDPDGWDIWKKIKLNNANLAGLPFAEGKIRRSDPRFTPELSNIIKRCHATRDIKSYFLNPKSTVCTRFAEMFYDSFKNLPPKPDNDFVHSEPVCKLVSNLKSRLSNLSKWCGITLPQNYIDVHLANVFLKDVYGNNYDNPGRRVQANSKIVQALKQVLKHGFWGTHYHLNLLSEIFNVNFHCLENHKAKYPFRDSVDNPTITINNMFNNHWTTLIPISNNNSDNSNVSIQNYERDIEKCYKKEIQARFKSYTTGFIACFFGRNHMKKAKEIIAACQDKEKTVANIIEIITEYCSDPSVKFNPDSSFKKRADFILQTETYFKTNDPNETQESNSAPITIV
jgi:hypothetical protein